VVDWFEPPSEDGDRAGALLAPGAGSVLGAAGVRVRAFWARHPFAGDVGIAVAVAVVSTPWLVRLHPHDLDSWVFQLLLIVPLVALRRAPVTVFAAMSGVAFVQWLVSDRLLADLGLLVALFAIALLRSRRTAVAAATVVELGAVLASVGWSPADGWIRSLVFLSGLVAAAVLLGVNIRARRAHLAMLTERAERLEHERDQQARIAADAERTRIAREMHDVLAHSLAVMISLADGAGAKLRAEPDRSAEAIAQVSALGRQSLGDTRRLLGVLRAGAGDGPGTAPQPGIRQLDDLVAGVRATGLRASLTVAGDPFELAPGAGLTVYRIVQEALTNAVKHASGARAVDVRLRYQAPQLDVEVVDDGHPAPVPVAPGPAAELATGGHGLAGMRERASVYRGHVDAGPGAGGGWRVGARLLVGPAARGAR
jgi:signal transduction histidine kinase